MIVVIFLWLRFRSDTNVTTKNESHVKQEPKDVDMTDLTECSLTDIDVKVAAMITQTPNR
jgi:hypothetical protein